MSEATGGGGGLFDPRVAETLQQLRSGVRQRQAEVATMGGAAAGLTGGAGGAGDAGGVAALAQGLLAVKSHEYVEEPIAFSHRAGLGKAIVFVRKAFFHLFLKWFMRPVLAQQNAFNQAAGRLLQDLAETEERLLRDQRLLAARLAQLEAPRGARPADAARQAGGAVPADAPRPVDGGGEERRG